MIYLDHNATTPIDSRVLEAMMPALTEQFGNPASSTHAAGWYAEELVRIAREEVAAILAANPEEILFTSGATESNNLALFGTLDALAKRQDTRKHVLSVSTEHRSVLDPLQELTRRGYDVTLLPVAKDGSLATETLQQALRDDTALVSIMLANNEIGVLHDIAALTTVVRNNSQATIHCDATQAVGKVPVSVTNLDVDLLSLSAHKIYGPKGVGALYRSKKTPLSPLLYGGGHEDGLRAGTLPVPAIVGFGAACNIANAELEQDAAHLCSLSQLFLTALSDAQIAYTLNGSAENRIPGNLNLQLHGVQVANLIGKIGAQVALSSTSACTSGTKKGSHVLAALGLEKKAQQESIRIGFGRATTTTEVKKAVESIAAAI